MSEHEPDLFDNLRLELRRGCLVLAVLIELRTDMGTRYARPCPVAA
jgi:hypothetical protein